MQQLNLLDLLDRPPMEALYKPDQIFDSNDYSLFTRISEDTRFDRKSGLAQAPVLAKCLSAFGNGQSVDGGVLAIGVEKNGEITGCGHLEQSRLADVETCGVKLCPDGRFKSCRLLVKNKYGNDDFIVLVRIFYVDDLACCRFSGHHPKLTQPFFQTQLG